MTFGKKTALILLAACLLAAQPASPRPARASDAAWVALGVAAGAALVTTAALNAYCSENGPPVSFRAVFPEAVMPSHSIVFSPATPVEDRWARVANAVEGHFTPDIVDPDQGLIRTQWNYHNLDRLRVGESCATTLKTTQSQMGRYRTRLRVEFTDREWTIVRITQESNWMTQDGVWVNGLDTQILDEAYNSILAGLGGAASSRP